MTPKEPYLIRAFHQWILDNDCTPYIVVDTYQPCVQVPAEYIQPNGQITLNISPEATGSLCMADDAIEFNARFGGQPHHLYIPYYAVLAIVSKETGEGTEFMVMPAEQREQMLQSEEPQVKAPKLQAVKTPEPESTTNGDDPDPDKPKKRKASHLSVVK